MPDNPSIAQRFASFMSQQLPVWNSASIFPEGVGSTDVFQLQHISELFLGDQEAALGSVTGGLQRALDAKDPTQLLRQLDEAVLIQSDAARARVFFKLLKVQHPEEKGFSTLYEQVADRCNALDARIETFAQTLKTVPLKERETWARLVPALNDHRTLLLSEKFTRYPGYSPEDAAKISQKINDGKIDYMRVFHENRASGPIRSHEPERLNIGAEAFNQMLYLTDQEAKLEGYGSPLERYAAYQHLPASQLQHWLDISKEPARVAADSMHQLIQGHPIKDKMIRLNFSGPTPHLYSWDEARSMVTDALTKFNPQFRPILDQAFKEGWLQAKPIPNNPYGGETYNNVPAAYYPQAHPFVLSEFKGSIFDVIRLAHELGGHCLSIQMANNAEQPYHVTDSTLQETFALFSQRLVLDEMLARTNDSVQRAAILRTAADDWVQNLYETTTRCRFQQAAYDQARQPDGSLRSLGARELTDLFTATNVGSVYGSQRTNPEEPYRWANIHHFETQAPFYNASYGYATMASAALYEQWSHALPDQRMAMSRGWANIMQQGGMVRFPDAMKQMGINVLHPDFFRTGVESVQQSITAAEGAMRDVSSWKLLTHLSPSEIWETVKVAVGSVFKNPLRQEVAPASRPSTRTPTPSAPAQPIYPTPLQQNPAHAEALAVATTELPWVERVGGGNAMRAADAPQPWQTRMADQAQMERENKSVPVAFV